MNFFFFCGILEPILSRRDLFCLFYSHVLFTSEFCCFLQLLHNTHFSHTFFCLTISLKGLIILLWLRLHGANVCLKKGPEITLVFQFQCKFLLFFSAYFSVGSEQAGADGGAAGGAACGTARVSWG